MWPTCVGVSTEAMSDPVDEDAFEEALGEVPDSSGLAC